MQPIYFPIIKALDAEAEAFNKISPVYKSKTIPLLEISALKKKTPKYISKYGTPKLTQITESIKRFQSEFSGKMVMLDSNEWEPDTLVESNEHIYTNIIHQAQSQGIIPIPVIGYDRLDDQSYYQAILSLNYNEFPAACLRIDEFGIEDSKEKDHFQNKIFKLLDDLNLNPKSCFVLVDFGDSSSLDKKDMLSSAINVIDNLLKFDFKFYVTSGTSIPSTIDKSIKNENSAGIVPRKEFSLWKEINLHYKNSNTKVLFSDYCVRSPSNNDGAIITNSNGKIRYTIDNAFYIIRGYSVKKLKKFSQYEDLAKHLVNSSHYLGAIFSWGDKQALLASNGIYSKTHAYWIAADTNHHVAFVISEINSLNSKKIITTPIVTI